MPDTVVTVQNPESKPGKPGVENGNVNNIFSWVEINYNYFKTLPGILKLAQLVSFMTDIIRLKYNIRIIHNIIIRHRQITILLLQRLVFYKKLKLTFR